MVYLNLSFFTFFVGRKIENSRLKGPNNMLNCIHFSSGFISFRESVKMQVLNNLKAIIIFMICFLTGF